MCPSDDIFSRPMMVVIVCNISDRVFVLQGVCQKLAESKNVATCRLPLEENVDMKTRKVLAVNHGRY